MKYLLLLACAACSHDAAANWGRALNNANEATRPEPHYYQPAETPSASDDMLCSSTKACPYGYTCVKRPIEVFGRCVQ